MIRAELDLPRLREYRAKFPALNDVLTAQNSSRNAPVHPTPPATTSSPTTPRSSATSTVGELSSFWFNAVVRGDVAPVTIGRRVNVQDGVVIHCDTDVPNVIEDDVTIGHGAIVHGTFVGQGHADRHGLRRC